MPDNAREVVPARDCPDPSTASAFRLQPDWTFRMSEVAQAVAYRTKDGQILGRDERTAVQAVIDYLTIAQKNDARNVEALLS